MTRAEVVYGALVALTVTSACLALANFDFTNEVPYDEAAVSLTIRSPRVVLTSPQSEPAVSVHPPLYFLTSSAIRLVLNTDDPREMRWTSALFLGLAAFGACWLVVQIRREVGKSPPAHGSLAPLLVLACYFLLPNVAITGARLNADSFVAFLMVSLLFAAHAHLCTPRTFTALAIPLLCALVVIAHCYGFLYAIATLTGAGLAIAFGCRNRRTLLALTPVYVGLLVVAALAASPILSAHISLIQSDRWAREPMGPIYPMAELWQLAFESPAQWLSLSYALSWLPLIGAVVCVAQRGGRFCRTLGLTLLATLLALWIIPYVLSLRFLIKWHLSWYVVLSGITICASIFVLPLAIRPAISFALVALLAGPSVFSHMTRSKEGERALTEAREVIVEQSIDGEIPVVYGGSRPYILFTSRVYDHGRLRNNSYAYFRQRFAPDNFAARGLIPEEKRIYDRDWPEAPFQRVVYVQVDSAQSVKADQSGWTVEAYRSVPHPNLTVYELQIMTLVRDRQLRESKGAENETPQQ